MGVSSDLQGLLGAAKLPVNINSLQFKILLFLEKIIICFAFINIVRMWLSDPISKVGIGNNMSNSFQIRSKLKQGNALLPLLINFALEYAILKIKQDKKGLTFIVNTWEHM